MPFVTIRQARIEYTRIDAGDATAPTIVMLHEGLGSVDMWKELPKRLATSARCNVVAYSRQGHGRSSRLECRHTVRYMHHEAQTILPRFLGELKIECPILFGHSDGGSIALIFAGSNDLPVAGVIAIAPHVLVEDLTISGIAAARAAYESGEFRGRLARYHDDVDAAFYAWNDIWLDPTFHDWNIEKYLPRISCPVLAIQGAGDAYGTMEQIERIARAVPATELVRLPDCGHSPHRDQPELLLDAVVRWIPTIPVRSADHRVDTHV